MKSSTYSFISHGLAFDVDDIYISYAADLETVFAVLSQKQLGQSSWIYVVRVSRQNHAVRIFPDESQAHGDDIRDCMEGYFPKKSEVN